MRCLVDAQLPPALARRLTERGHPAEHVMDRGLQSASDREIWNYALEVNAVIVTKDEDFAQRKALAGAGPSVIWVRLPNSRRGQLLNWFEQILPQVVDAIEHGETLIEVI